MARSDRSLIGRARAWRLGRRALAVAGFGAGIWLAGVAAGADPASAQAPSAGVGTIGAGAPLAERTTVAVPEVSAPAVEGTTGVVPAHPVTVTPPQLSPSRTGTGGLPVAPTRRTPSRGAGPAARVLAAAPAPKVLDVSPRVVTAPVERLTVITEAATRSTGLDGRGTPAPGSIGDVRTLVTGTTTTLAADSDVPLLDEAAASAAFAVRPGSAALPGTDQPAAAADAALIPERGTAVRAGISGGPRSTAPRATVGSAAPDAAVPPGAPAPDRGPSDAAAPSRVGSSRAEHAPPGVLPRNPVRWVGAHDLLHHDARAAVRDTASDPSFSPD